jgi:hypothetical protein
MHCVMAEAEASDATLMAVSGHMSRRMLDHYSHVRMAAKRTALDKLESGLMGTGTVPIRSRSGKQLNGYVTYCVTKALIAGGPWLDQIERVGRRGWTRTSDHLLRRHAHCFYWLHGIPPVLWFFNNLGSLLFAQR